MNKNQVVKSMLIEKISKSEIGLVLDILLQINKYSDVDADNEKGVIIQSSRFEDIERQRRNDTISVENYNTIRNQITQSIIEIIEGYRKRNDFEKALNSEYKYQLLTIFSHEQKLIVLEDEMLSLFAELKEVSESYYQRNPHYEWITLWESQLAEFEAKWDDRRFHVAIVALVKAGKSTLLNAWIGNEYLPSATLPETMQVTRIRHNQTNEEGILYINGEEKEKGVEDIRKHLRKLNDSSRASKKESEVLLEVNLAVLKNRSLSGYGFDILDTPGTNESGVATLQAKVEHLGKTSDVIIYLIDFTKLNTEDEAQMFENLKKWRQELFTQLKSRLFFVVNKIDVNNRHDREKKMSADEIKKYVANVLFNYANIKIDQNDIILVSAELALLSRLVGNKIASEEQLHDFKVKAFGAIGFDEATDEDCYDAVPKLVAKSGFKELEEKVLELIYSNRSFIFFKSIIDDVEKALGQVVNNLEISRGTLKSNQETIQKLKKKIISIKEGIGSFADESNDFKKKAEEIIQKRLKEFDDSVSKIISDAFARTAGSTKIINKNILSSLIVNKYFLDYVDYEILDTDKDDLMRKLDLINKYVIESIESQFELIWSNIIEDIYSQYLVLKENLQVKSKPVISQVEEAINESFEIKLNPSNFAIKSPSFIHYYREMHYDLTSLVKDRFDFSGNVIFNIINILKKWFSAFFNNNYSTYKITTIDYKKRISQTTDGVISESTIIANDFVRSKYINTVKEAEISLAQFIERYIAIIEREIATRQAKITDISERILNIETDIQDTKNIIRKLVSINRSIEKIK